jgi:HD-GYP domain-containing protein (c-di-GMP phosphodiesterase class II)
MIREIDISKLIVGHYILDIAKQKGEYYLTGAGHVRNNNVIQRLHRKSIKTLLIDTSKTLRKSNDENVDAVTAESIIGSNERPIILSVRKAKKVFGEAKKILTKIFEDVLHERELNLTPVIHVTNKVIGEIFKNPNALAYVINIRQKNEYNLEHSISVSILMTIFASYLKIDKKIIQPLSVGAFLHDVGKVMVPEKILNKPGKLTEGEFEIMKSHVNHAIDILTPTPDLSDISLEVVTLRNERLDGSGYPFQIQDKEISQYGRMIAICDIFDALTTNRCYKNAYSHISAFRILRKLAQKNQLDLTLVDHFIKCMGIYPVSTLVKLNSNKLAIVERKNEVNPTSPKVISFYNLKGNHYEMPKKIDLSNDDDFIVKAVKAKDFDLDMNKIIEFLLMEG